MSIASHIVDLPHCGSEAELLLGCGRTRIDQAVAERIRRALQRQIDWNYLMCQAAYHGMIPLLYRHMNSDFVEYVPKTVLDQLRFFANRITFQNLALTGELLKLLKLFQQQGIRALPIKGPILALSAYGNLSLRPFGDLDILVAKDDMLNAKAVIVSQGYHPKYNLDAGEEQAYLKSHHDYQFISATDGAVVDLQRGITQLTFAFPVDFEYAWKCRETISVGGSLLFNLAPELLLLILCVHGTKHRWSQLKWICDVAELIETRRESLDWPLLVRQARALGGERMLLLGLLLSTVLLGVCLPREIEEMIGSNPTVISLARQVRGRLFTERRDTDLLVELEEGPLFFWSARERWRDRAAIAWKYSFEYFGRLILPNQNDARFLKLPPSLAFCYYFVHPLRLLSDYLSKPKPGTTNAQK